MKEFEGEMVIPELFRCPISLDLLKDPVTLSTGQTYERSSIQQWLSSGNLTCPVTMQQLHDTAMVPNHTLRHLIARWLRTAGPTAQFDPRGSSKAEPLAALRRGLESARDDTAKSRALETVAALSEDPYSAPCLVQLDFLPLLLDLAFGGPESTKLAAQALSCAAKLLPFSGLECLNALESERFVSLFKRGSSSMRIDLCRLISIASSSSTTTGLCLALGRDRELLHEMAAFVGHGSEASDAGIEALWTLSCFEASREALVGEGAVEGLISYLVAAGSGEGGRERSLAPQAMAVLERLLALESAREALMRSPNGVGGLVKRVFKVSESDPEGSESAVAALTMACCGSLKAREEAIEAGVLTQLLLLLQSQCSGRTKTKARKLLNLLRSKRTQDHN